MEENYREMYEPTDAPSQLVGVAIDIPSFGMLYPVPLGYGIYYDHQQDCINLFQLDLEISTNTTQTSQSYSNV